MKNIEKFFYISVGLAAEASKKIEQTVQELVEQNNLNKDEAKKIVDNLKKLTRKYSSDINNKFNELVKSTLEELNFVKQKDLDKIHKKLDEIENKIKNL